MKKIIFFTCVLLMTGWCIADITIQVPRRGDITITSAQLAAEGIGSDANAVKLTGNQTIAGTKRYTTIPIVADANAAAITAAGQLTNKAYVDSLICIPDPCALTTSIWVPITNHAGVYAIPFSPYQVIYAPAADANYTLPAAVVGHAPIIIDKVETTYTIYVHAGSGNTFDDASTLLTNTTAARSRLRLECVKAGIWHRIEEF